MGLSPEDKAGVISQYAINTNDSGSAQVQVALITARLNYLLDHFKKHKQDHHSRRGLLKLVGRRRRLLDYIKRRDVQEYRDLIQKLGIRK
ncbi:MAG: 30S ribosomal protein S15 [bacterium]|nr:30S ribosomal protein S15 [bacterium]